MLCLPYPSTITLHFEDPSHIQGHGRKHMHKHTPTHTNASYLLLTLDFSSVSHYTSSLNLSAGPFTVEDTVLTTVNWAHYKNRENCYTPPRLFVMVSNPYISHLIKNTQISVYVAYDRPFAGRSLRSTRLADVLRVPSL